MTATGYNWHGALLAAALLAATIGAMGTSGNAAAQQAHPGPWLPPDKRTPSAEPPASGEALRAQAMQKLKQRFDEADLDASGSLTREEAGKAGLGMVVKNFDRIDVAHRGAVSFDDLKAFLQQRRKEAMAQRGESGH
jgi:hypothetical protein